MGKRLSFSRYKRFRFGCENEALNSVFQETEATAVGKLVEMIATGEPFDDFVQENAQFFISKRGGGYKKAFNTASEIAVRLCQDPYFKELLKREKQKRVEFNIDGIPWLGFADFVGQGVVSDLKVVKSVTEDSWCDIRHTKVPFYIEYEYAFQGAVYTKGLALDKFELFAIAKDTGARKIIEFPKELLDSAWEDILLNQSHIWDVYTGKVEPRRCEKCKTCVDTQEKAIVEIAYDFIVDKDQTDEAIYGRIYS